MKANDSSSSRRPLLWFCVLGLVVVGVFLIWNQIRMRSYQANWARMQSFRAQTDALAKTDQWHKILELAVEQKKNVPDDANAYWMAAKSQFHTGNYAQAIADWETASKIEPSWKDQAVDWISKSKGGIAVQKLRLPQPVETIAEEEQERRGLRKEAEQLLRNRDYDGLEKRAAQLRVAKSIFPDGRSKLRTFHDGLAYLPGEKILPAPTIAANIQEAEKIQAARQAHLISLEKWSHSRTSSVTAQTAFAYGCLVGAWKVRGSGYASQVGKEHFAAMQNRLRQAGEVLIKSSALRAQCPVWYTTAQQVALLQSWPRKDYDQLCAFAIQDYPNYQEIYLQRLKYLMPRWQGKPGEWEQEAEKVADAIARTSNSPIEGDIFYARGVGFLREVQPEIFKETAASWPRVKRGLQALKKRNPGSLEVGAALLFLAGEAGDFTLMKSLYQNSIKDRWDSRYWESKQAFNQHRCWVFSPR